MTRRNTAAIARTFARLVLKFRFSCLAVPLLIKKRPATPGGSIKSAGLCPNDRVFLLRTAYDTVFRAVLPVTRVRHLFAHKPLPFMWRPPQETPMHPLGGTGQVVRNRTNPHDAVSCDDMFSPYLSSEKSARQKYAFKIPLLSRNGEDRTAANRHDVAIKLAKRRGANENGRRGGDTSPAFLSGVSIPSCSC
jgi:hypothetical protein